ncbi:hypothetical protein [Rubripirellula tenax]|uniref:hypothetical protein n=1 Tax=Rubripirellula tenax TaxID=2528015 RepID=UPI001648613B|nr:hypothetical protein [Rubripirellula tenax]
MIGRASVTASFYADATAATSRKPRLGDRVVTAMAGCGIFTAATTSVTVFG